MEDKLGDMLRSKALVALFVLPLTAIGIVCDGLRHDPAHMIPLRHITEGGRLHLAANGLWGQVPEQVTRLWMIDQE